MNAKLRFGPDYLQFHYLAMGGLFEYAGRIRMTKLHSYRELLILSTSLGTQISVSINSSFLTEKDAKKTNIDLLRRENER